MTIIQSLVLAFASPTKQEQIRAESESWVLRCPHCNKQRSVWELGGVRYGATSKSKRIFMRCVHCNQRSWMPMERRDDAQQ